MAIVLILILGLILRLVNLNQSLWLDEAVQTITAKGPFLGIFAELQGDFHPPLYHIFMWGWVHLFGNSEIVVRLPSVLFGTVTIWVVYLIAKSFTSEVFLSSMAALFLATAPFHIYYSQEARPYALVTLLAVCSMYFFLKEKWLGYIVSTSLALYSSYFVLFLILSQVLAILVRKKYYQFVYILVSLLFFLPWLPIFFTQIEVGRQAVSFLPEWGRLVNLSFLKALPLTFIKFSLGRITIFDKKLYASVVAILFLAYSSIITRGFFKDKKLTINHQSLFILLWLAVPVFSAWLISLFIPNYQPFRLLLVLPAFYLLLAYGVSKINIIMIRATLVGLVLMVNLISLKTYFFNPYFHREDWRGVVKFIEGQERNIAVIIPSVTSSYPWRYYSSGKREIVGVSPLVREVADEDFNRLTIQPSNHLTIYYIRYLVSLFDPQEKISSWLVEDGFVKIREISFNQIPVWEYKRL